MSRSRMWMGYVAVAVTGLAMAVGIAFYWSGQYDQARVRYVASNSADSRFVADKVNGAFASIYQNIRTLSMLPSVRSLDRHGTTLSDEAKTTIQQIYNNLATDVDVSEVYILPVDFDPEKIDPATGHHETPILAFDQLIAPGNATGDDAGGGADDSGSKNPPDQDFVGTPDSAGLPQVEIQEYRRLKQQLAWLSANYPTLDKIDGMKVPMIGSPELITCDNTVFDKTRNDEDRSGLIQLVPFYGTDGKLKGGVAAIMRSNAYRALLPDHDYALVNMTYNFSTRPVANGQESASAAWVKQGRADPTLVYSETVPLTTADGTSNWAVWAGRPDAAFYGSADMVNLRTSAIGSFLAIGVLMLTAFGVCFLVNRNARAAAAASSLLEGRVSARTAEINGLAMAAEAESARRLARVNETSEMNESLAAVVEAALLGDFSKRVKVNLEDAGLVALARGVNDLVETVDRGVSEAGRVLSALAHTDLTQRFEGQYAGSLKQLKDDTNAVSERLTDVVGQLREAAGTVHTATGEILQGANDLAERTTRQAAGLEEASASIERLAATTAEIAQRAESANAKANQVSRTASNTNLVMDQATLAMGRISDASGKISNIIGLIDDIAFQTNLLALNASVEAARAGQAGNGFAVVAVEVRRLAQSAGAASSQVKALVHLATGEIAGGNKLVAEAAASLSTMLAGIRENSELVGRIAEATSEQSKTITAIADTVRTIDQMTQHNAALVEETNAAIEQTEVQADVLDRLVDVFKIGGDVPRTMRSDGDGTPSEVLAKHTVSAWAQAA